MDNRPIGVFDSGLGGLTAVKEIISALPGEDIIYFGDTGRVPYGTRSNETIIKYVRQDIRFLLTHNIKTIVVACGTVSTVALDAARQASNVSLMGVVEPSVAKALKLTKNGRIGVIGTPAAIKSGAYERHLKQNNPELFVINNACPLFVPLVENGYIEQENTVARLVAQEYLAPIKDAGVDTIIMGCTHYPLLTHVISSVMGNDVKLIDPGKEAANVLAATLKEKDMLSDRAYGRHQFYVSDTIDNFAKLGSMFLNEDINGTVKRIDIDSFGEI